MKMNFEEGILDALADDGESIQQISEHLQHLDIKYSIGDIVEMLLKMFNEKLIKIVYPRNRTIMDFKNASCEDKYNYWFELTELGKEEWSKIE